ncbi:sensor histidine kinase [Aquabacterium sp.]|uniref:sensor histidine kinase n=1 Tax=Aquabacterium sp. TaxID=1872578 RepID=UPI0025C0E64C|nr:histidine kinase [Aquabacterium sp.]
MDSTEPKASGASQAQQAAAWELSTQFSPTQFGPGADGRQAPPSPFDVCHVGVVLRVVLGVQLVVALGVAFASLSPVDWLHRWAQSTVLTLPASLLWLVVACALRKPLTRASDAVQWGVAMVLGAVCGGLGQLQASWLDLALSGLPFVWGWPQVPPMLTGGAIAAVGLSWLKHRARSELPAHASARLAELQARIRPHFLFNTLNTAIALVQIDPQRAEAVLEDLAELFRQALSSPTMRTTLRSEIDLAQRYLSIEQLRFGERVTVRWELDEEAGRAEVPALILQPLVENAVRHGIEVSPQGGWIVVRTKAQSGRVVLTVSNSVPAETPTVSSAGHGIALRNVRQRLKLMHDVEAEFEAGLQGGGDTRQPPVYVVRMVVPLPRKETAQ